VVVLTWPSSKNPSIAAELRHDEHDTRWNVWRDYPLFDQAPNAHTNQLYLWTWLAQESVVQLNGSISLARNCPSARLVVGPGWDDPEAC
jgi:hypothetical protein